MHNSYRPNATDFRPAQPPSFANGNVLLVTEEDYEQTDCSKAGSFQTWWVKRLDGTQGRDRAAGQGGALRPRQLPAAGGRLLLVALVRLPTSSGIVAAGFYGGGTQLLDVRNPRDIKAYGHAFWGASEVWDAMWAPGLRPQRPPVRPHQQRRLLHRPGPWSRRVRRRRAR